MFTLLDHLLENWASADEMRLFAERCEHHEVGQRTPLCNLWLELLHKHDLDVGNFGSSQQDMKLLGT